MKKKSSKDNGARQGVQRAFSTPKRRVDMATVDTILARLWAKGFKVVPVKRKK